MRPRAGRGACFARRDWRAFSRVDLLSGLAAVSILAAIVVVPWNRARNKSRLAQCVENLKQIGKGIHQFASEHESTLPGPASTQSGDSWWWYKEQIKGYLGLTGQSSTNDRVFACPVDRGYSDPKPFCQTPRFDYSSYVFNGVTLLGAPNIAGWKLSAIRQPVRSLLVMEWSAHAPLSWHRSRTGKANAPFYNDAESVVTFVDGHVALTKIYYDGHTAAYLRDPIPGYDYQYSGH